MKNRHLRSWYLIAVIALLYPAGALRAQLNAELLHQLVQHSKDENEHQITARNKQVVTSAQQQVNSHKAEDLKAGYTLLQSRFKTLEKALQVLSLGLESAPIVRDIARQQQRIVNLATDKPQLLLLALDAQQQIAPAANRLARYLLGIFISTGDLNQMKASDRRILYTHAVDELRALAATIRSLAKAMESAAYKSGQKGSSFSDFINIDIPIAQDILNTVSENP